MMKPNLFLLGALFGLLLTSCPQTTNPPTPVQNPGGMSGTAGWERDRTTFYHLWVSAFSDGTSEATGNSGTLAGITGKINGGYFTELGINALWLSPIFEASSLSAGSSNKHGYDTIDFNTVSSLYGDEYDLADLIASAHDRGIRVIFDWVPNHTSPSHPWFIDSSSGSGAPKRNWYVWASASQTWPGNGFSGTPDWWQYSSGNWYYGVFGSGMPDLNYGNSAVVSAMNSSIKKWLDFGFDGLRIDAVKYLVGGSSPGTYKDQPGTHTYFDNLRANLIDSTDYTSSPKMMMAENWDGNMSNVLSYIKNGSDQEFNVALDFIWPYTIRDQLNSPSSVSGAVTALAAHLVGNNNTLRTNGGSFGTFESNHDNVVSRPNSLYGGNVDKIWLASALTILGPGTPIIYYGNEIGMTGQATDDRNLRQPFRWADQATQKADANSLWNWNKTLLNIRNSNPAYADPVATDLSQPSNGLLAFLITGNTNGQKLVVAANLSGSSNTFTLSTGGTTATTILGDDSKTSLSGGTLTLTNLPDKGIRVIALDQTGLTASTADAGTKTISLTITYPALYLRGSFNSWGTSGTGAPTGSVYSATSASLTGGTAYEFKFGNTSWSEAYGWSQITYDTSQAGAVASTTCVQAAADNNIKFTPPTTKTYTFYFDYLTKKYWIK